MNRTLMKETPVENICRVLDGEFVHQDERYRPNGNVYIVTNHQSVALSSSSKVL